MKESGQEKYNRLRREHPEFIYSAYSFAESAASLDFEYEFEIPGLAVFTPRWSIAKAGSCLTRLNTELIDTLVFSLGMVELVSYWKLTCSPSVRVDCAGLDEAQCVWWVKLYRKGLGEFLYVNGIEPDGGFMEIRSRSGDGRGYGVGGNGRGGSGDWSGGGGLVAAAGAQDTRVLIPIGGGKDSAVTLELLRAFPGRLCYMINPGKAMTGTAAAGGILSGSIVTARRELDNNMLELNKQGYLNGHTPFSALVAFSSLIAAYMHGAQYVALSNESSANEPTVKGSDVNHQYSKSFEFETDFIDYEAEYLSSGIKYFSLLRPLTELGIASVFSRCKQYHTVFRSCNAGSREGIWCAKCPKCLFVYIILAPFMPARELQRIFGRNLLDDAALLPVFEKLTGAQPEKPFECVGSHMEVNAAVQETIRRFDADGKPLPVLLEAYKRQDYGDKYDFAGLCMAYDENNHIPDVFTGAVKDAVRL